MPQSYSLFELNEYIRRVIALNFAEPIWVNAEISQVKEVRGNVYLDLVYHDEKTNEITAQISAGIWYKSYLFLKNKLGHLLPSLLSVGTHVLVKVQVEFTERYGMKLIIEDLDPSFTIGQMEMNRQKILQKLHDEGLTQLNKLKSLPTVVQNIAVLSSEIAAGYIDFINHLTHNIYNYQFTIKLYPVAMQGQNTEREVCQALDMISSQDEKFDCVLIIRGGGSKLDLAWFDNYNIGSKIAHSKIPVITGIGHDIDSTVADVVSHTSLKTPTAVADFIIHHNADFESQIVEAMHWITQMATRSVRENQMSLQQTIQYLKYLPKELLKSNALKLDLLQQQLTMACSNKIRNHKDLLRNAQKQIDLQDPRNIVRKGYTIVRQNGKIVQYSKKYNVSLSTEIEFFDGKISI